MSADDRSGGSAQLTRRQKQNRDAEVYAARRRGVSWSAIEQRHGISERQGRRIVDRIAARRPAIELDPDEVVRELLAHYAQAVEDLALLIDSPNDTVRVAAITRRVEIVERRVLTLRELGLLPADWRRWHRDLDGRVLFSRMVEILRRLQLFPATSLTSSRRSSTRHPMTHRSSWRPHDR